MSHKLLTKIISIIITSISIYLTIHYFEINYPQSISSTSSFCNFSNAFSCDTAALSKFSNIQGIPISLFGIFFGILLIIGLFSKNEKLTNNIKVVSLLNVGSCIVLLIYSIFIQKSVCPFCFLYYILSAVIYIREKHYTNFGITIKESAIIALVFIIIAVPMSYQSNIKKNEYKKRQNHVLMEFLSLPNEKDPGQDSIFRLDQNKNQFKEAKIRISVFSDFQCPYCKTFALQTEKLIKRYGSAINIQYFFYPLDPLCNPNIQSDYHDFACQASVLAACDVSQFKSVHNELFENQEQINENLLKSTESKFNLTNCFENPEALNKVITSINQADQYQIKSTPTVIINGRKIEGVLSDSHMIDLLNFLLEDSE